MFMFEKIECCVCLEDKKCLNLKCKHPLCKNCYQQLIRKICPLCRQNLIIKKNIFQILSGTFMEIILFSVVVCFVYYTDFHVFNINNHQPPNSNIEILFAILRLIIDIFNLFS